jgi:hypothetical protein
VQANGELINACCGGNTDFDLNGDGLISGNSVDASASNGFGFGGGVINLNRAGAASQIVNYEASMTSYSIGGSLTSSTSPCPMITKLGIFKLKCSGSYVIILC